MKELTRQKYIENICDYEKLYLIIVEGEKIFLRADIEDAENLRIEMLHAELNPALKFLDAEQAGRENYFGKIYFIEYENNEIAAKNILKDFLNLADDAIFLLYENDDLKKILEIYPNKYIFLRMWKFLCAVALGLRPSKIWDSLDEANGGYIIVKESGEVLAYHLHNRDSFETYLLNNTRLETPSSGRHNFGKIYSAGDRKFINLNLQIRFI